MVVSGQKGIFRFAFFFPNEFDTVFTLAADEYTYFTNNFPYSSSPSLALALSLCVFLSRFFALSIYGSLFFWIGQKNSPEIFITNILNGMDELITFQELAVVINNKRQERSFLDIMIVED